MKLKLIAALFAALAVGAVQAQSVSSTSAASTGSMSVSGVVGNGFGYSSQKSGATAHNNSGAYATGATVFCCTYPRGTIQETGAASEGATSSYTLGVNLGSAFGASAAGAVQSGSADATAIGVYLVGGAAATSSAEVGSASGSANVNNGISANGTAVGAWNESYGFSTKSGPFQKSTGGASDGDTSSGSFGFAWGAVGATGGFATQSGAGGGL